MSHTLPGEGPGGFQTRLSEALNPALLDAIGLMLDTKLSQVEERICSRFARSHDTHENLIRIEEKVGAFSAIFDQMQTMNKTTQLIYGCVKDTNFNGVQRSSENDTTSDATSVNTSGDINPGIKTISDKLDILLKQEKELGAKIVNKFVSVQETLDSVSKKVTDTKSDGAEIFDNSEKILERVKKVHRCVDEKLPARLEDIADLHSEMRSTRKLIESFVKTDRPSSTSRGRRRSESDDESSPSRDVTILSVSSVEKSRKKSKKRSRSTSSDDDNENPDVALDEKSIIVIDKKICKLIDKVEDVETRVETWIKSSKKSMHKSDETTKCLLQQVLTNNKTLENIFDQQKTIQDAVQDSNRVSSEENLFRIATNLNDKIEKIETGLENLQSEQSTTFKNFSSDVMAISDNCARLSKLDELFQKLKLIYKQGSGHDKMFKDVKTAVENLQNTMGEDLDSKSTIRDTMVILRDLMPKMDDFYVKVIPMLEDIKKQQKIFSDIPELLENRNNIDVQKILSHLDDFAAKTSKPSDPRSLPTDTTVLQIFNAISELSKQSGLRDQTLQKVLAEIQRIRSPEKVLVKIASTLEEMKANSKGDMKTLSSMNTILQGMKTSSSSQLKELKQLLQDSKSPAADEISKSLEVVRSIQTELKSNPNNQHGLKQMLHSQTSSIVKAISELVQSEFRSRKSSPESVRNLDHLLQELNPVIDELKELKSSLSLTELDCKLDKVFNEVHEVPNEIGAITAALEENLGKNVEKFIENMFATVHNDIILRLEAFEQKIAPTSRQTKESLLETTNSHSGLSAHQPHAMTSSMCDEIVRQIQSECQLLGDGIAHTLDQFTAAADTTEVKKLLEELDSRIMSRMEELKQIEVKIFSEQAKSAVVEEQMEALANTVLQPIQEIRPLHDQLIKIIEEQFKNSIKDRKKSSSQDSKEIKQNFEKLHSMQNECLAVLTSLKRFHEFSSDDRVRDYLATNIEQAVEALTSNSSDAKSAHQAEVVKSLIEFLKRIQATQQDILMNSDRSIEYQASFNECLIKIVPIVELINRSLQQRRNLRLDSGPIPELCYDLRLKLATLHELEKKLIEDRQAVNVDDLSSLIKVCKRVMEQLSQDMQLEVKTERVETDDDLRSEDVCQEVDLSVRPSPADATSNDDQIPSNASEPVCEKPPPEPVAEIVVGSNQGPVQGRSRGPSWGPKRKRKLGAGKLTQRRKSDTEKHVICPKLKLIVGKRPLSVGMRSRSNSSDLQLSYDETHEDNCGISNNVQEGLESRQILRPEYQPIVVLEKISTYEQTDSKKVKRSDE